MEPIRPSNKNFEYEKVVPLEWAVGRIKELQERVNDNRKFKNKKTGEYEIKTVDELRIVFELDGYDYAHYSRWMSKSVAEKSTLYSKYLKTLVPGLKPDTAIDPNKLVGLKVKTMWNDELGKDGNTYQHVEMIVPLEVITPEDITLDEIEKVYGKDTDKTFAGG